MNRDDRSWVGLIAFCFTSTLTAGVALAAVLATASLTFAGEPAQASGLDNSGNVPVKTYSGVITDSYCGARHDKDSTLSSAGCTRMCVKKGAKYVMVNGDKTYLLDGDIGELNGLAGQRVEARGTLEGDTIHFTEIGFLSAAR